MKRLLTPLLGVLALACAASVFAATSSDGAAQPVLDVVAQKKEKNTYIVRIRDKSVMEYTGGINGFKGTKPAAGEKIDAAAANVMQYSARLETLHNQILQRVGSNAANKVYSYRFVANGFAAKLTPQQVDALRSSDDVAAVYKDELLQLHTNSTPQFLGLTERGQAWSKGWTGEDVVVGILDTGINPEHPSFADVATPKRGALGRLKPYGAIPESFSGEGCEFGNTTFNPTDADFSCNNKLIKAQYFVEGFGADTLVPTEFLSARDSDGHGSHTAGTAAGNYGVPAYIGDQYQGDISGVAPRARIAVYKVCWAGVAGAGCAASDSMAAIDQAVADGVDVINFSIGGASTSFDGPDNLAFLFAADAGVFVATSQGNSGPTAETTGTPAGAPWITAVGATQDDQIFATGVLVTAPLSLVGEYLALEGSGAISLADTGDISAEIVPSIPADGCEPLANAEAINGKIALVVRGVCGFAAKYISAQEAGARAIIVYNDGTAPDRIDPISMGGFDGSETIPGVMISYTAGAAMVREIASGETVTGTVGPTIQISLSDRIADFSSRGPNGGAYDIIKPDIAAPGVQILAAGSAQPNETAVSGPFVNLSGTSMASPHVAGLFALLKQAHPDWTPAMARSALMTTARANLRKTFGDEAADPFDIGAGFVVPNDAFSPGLVYDAGYFDYLAFTCETNVQLIDDESCAALEFAGYDKEASNLNLPSIAVADLTGFQIVRRTVTSVAKRVQRFRVEFTEPQGIEMFVWPSELRLAPGESASYQIAFKTKDDAAINEWAFGSLSWKYGRLQRSVTSPIAIRPVSLYAPASVSETGTRGNGEFDVVFGFDGGFSVAVDGLAEGIVSANTVDDGGVNQDDVFVIPENTTLARFAMYDAEVGDGSNGDDLDIQVYGPDTEGFPLAGSSQGASSEESVDIINPQPGLYIVVVFDFASADGPTAYTLYNYNLDGRDSGNLRVSAPESAERGMAANIAFSWEDLLPGTRYLGSFKYSNDQGLLQQQTEISINTQ